MKPINCYLVKSQSLISRKWNDFRDIGGITRIPYNHSLFKKQMAEYVCRTLDYFASGHRNVFTLSKFLYGRAFDSKFLSFYRCISGFTCFKIIFVVKVPKKEDFMNSFSKPLCYQQLQ